nr:immunoglobulin light chain junction region [Macaca mulatta]MOV97727.1 immunoglobulin light chain junction region [Macaca mulatta]MOW00791.1 immunoglobulin light chain junction region [Macaca mulatta]
EYYCWLFYTGSWVF